MESMWQMLAILFIIIITVIVIIFGQTLESMSFYYLHLIYKEIEQQKRLIVSYVIERVKADQTVKFSIAVL